MKGCEAVAVSPIQHSTLNIQHFAFGDHALVFTFEHHATETNGTTPLTRR
jgi:hypothetical protein